MAGSDAYAASKAGVVGLSRAMAVSLAKHEIRVNCVCPGVFLSAEVAARLENPTIQAQIAMSKPLRTDYGKPEELARVIAFLTSEEASFVNGIVVNVDGGGLA